jgi:hypothetical protein
VVLSTIEGVACQRPVHCVRVCVCVCVCVFVWASARPMQPGVSSDNMILAFKLFARPRSIPPPFGELPKQLGFNNFRIYRPLIICDHNY